MLILIFFYVGFTCAFVLAQKGEHLVCKHEVKEFYCLFVLYLENGALQLLSRQD